MQCRAVPLSSMSDMVKAEQKPCSLPRNYPFNPLNPSHPNSLSRLHGKSALLRLTSAKSTTAFHEVRLGRLSWCDAILLEGATASSRARTKNAFTSERSILLSNYGCTIAPPGGIESIRTVRRGVRVSCLARSAAYAGWQVEPPVVDLAL